MERSIHRLLIANRGEIAVRIARTCRALGIETVAVFSDADRAAAHVAAADRAVRIGPPPVAASYLNAGAILDAARAEGCDAIHPGYGFLAERAAFAQAVEAAGWIFVGPRSAAMAQLGDKAAARSLAASLGVPTVPGSPDVLTDDEILRQAAATGFPLVLKAAAGGGGRGMRVVQTAAELPEAIRIARSEAGGAFGDDRLLVERWVERGRHVEVQIVGGHDGRAIALGTRDCSVQRRHQKLIEEAPAPSLPAPIEQQVVDAAVRLFEHAGYQGAGTAEFLYDVERQAAYFLEVNTRLQVEHPVTEAIYGIDLVAWQLDVAQGRPLPPLAPPRGHAIEARLYAEDPITLLPAVGRLDVLRFPAGDGVRVDAGCREGDWISPHYDPLLAKLIVWDEDRARALARLRDALRQTAVVGTVVNLPLLRAILARPDLAEVRLDTAFLDRHAAALREAVLEAPDEPAWRELLRAWVGAAEWPRDPWSRAGAWSTAGPLQSTVQVADAAGRVLAERAVVLPAPSGAATPLSCRRADGSLDVVVDGVSYRLQRPRPPAPTAGAGAAAASAIVAPMPGTVLQVFVQPGSTVEPGQTLAILEAMKMQHQITAPNRAVVEQVRCSAGDLVTGGATLFALGEPPVDEAAPPAGE